MSIRRCAAEGCDRHTRWTWCARHAPQVAEHDRQHPHATPDDHPEGDA